MKTLNKLQRLVDDLNHSTSTNAKIKVFEQYSEMDDIREILVRIYSPYIQFGVGSKNCKKLSHICDSDDAYELFDLLDDLSNRHLTGHAAVGAVNAFILANKEHEQLIYNILDKDLKTRTAASIINKGIPGLIPQFKVALAEAINDMPDFENEEWFGSRKLDGVRCIIRKEQDEISAHSRSGKEFETLGKLLDEVSKIEGDFVLDGEVCIVDENGNENFQDIMKQIRRKNHTIDNLKMFVFDMLTLQEFDEQKGVTPLYVRYENSINALHVANCNKNIIEVLDQDFIPNVKYFNHLNDEATAAGHEGIMIRKDVGYKGKRSKDILKVKKFHDAEYKVVGATNGDIRIVEDGKEKTINCLSNIVIVHKGNKVGVGSGFSIDQRKEFYKDHNKILGKTVTVQYFEESQNKDGEWSLRFPVLKHIYEGERDC
jgi:DNA ligase-1